MLFMVTSRPRAGATREQLIEHLTRRLDPSTWDLIRHGVLSHVLYKVGDEPGFFAVLNAPSIEEAKAMVEAGWRGLSCLIWKSFRSTSFRTLPEVLYGRPLFNSPAEPS
jgi:hypothetical protein